jgi:hypothetical protein
LAHNRIERMSFENITIDSGYGHILTLLDSRPAAGRWLSADIPLSRRRGEFHARGAIAEQNWVAARDRQKYTRQHRSAESATALLKKPHARS